MVVAALRRIPLRVSDDVHGTCGYPSLAPWAAIALGLVSGFFDVVAVLEAPAA